MVGEGGAIGDGRGKRYPQNYKTNKKRECSSKHSLFLFYIKNIIVGRFQYRAKKYYFIGI
jgi:hypothetical protein